MFQFKRTFKLARSGVASVRGHSLRDHVCGRGGRA